MFCFFFLWFLSKNQCTWHIALHQPISAAREPAECPLSILCTNERQLFFIRKSRKTRRTHLSLLRAHTVTHWPPVYLLIVLLIIIRSIHWTLGRRQKRSHGTVRDVIQDRIIVKRGKEQLTTENNWDSRTPLQSCVRSTATLRGVCIGHTRFLLRATGPEDTNQMALDGRRGPLCPAGWRSAQGRRAAASRRLIVVIIIVARRVR